MHEYDGPPINWQSRKTQMDELQETVETIMEMDEPETILPTLRRAAERKKGVRWARLAQVLAYAEDKLDELNGKPVTAPQPEAVNTDEEAKAE